MNQQIFQQRFLPLMPRLYNMALALLDNEADAEDAVQDTYLKLWGMASRLDNMDTPEAYFVTTLRNKCLGLLRDRQRENNINNGATDISDIDLADDFDEADARKERLSVFDRVWGRLSPRARKVLRMRHVGGCSVQTIAQLTGDTETTIRAVLSRSRKRLREEYLHQKELE